MEKNEKDDLLLERVKELSCLYDLSKIAQNPDLTFTEILQASVERIPLAWKYADCAVCELKIHELSFQSHDFTEKKCSQQHVILLNNKTIGSITVHYTDTNRCTEDFLEEEELLLEKIAVEMGLVIERHETRKREINYIQNMQRQDRLNILSEITAGIAHELNTPLGTIFGFSQLIISSESNKQTIADAQKIFDAAKHASEIVKKLMLFSCDLPQNYELTSLNSLIENAIRLLHPNLLNAKVHIRFQHDELEHTIKLDPIQISQVIFNLIINAIQASSPNDTIEVSLNTLEQHAILKITDHGKGIEASIIDKIFEPFFSTKKSTNGTGLGLSVVHGIIRAHGGSISVESEPNKQTTFTVSLPITK